MRKRALISVITLVIYSGILLAGCEHASNSRRRSYVGRHPELTAEQRDLILKGKLFTGMRPKDVLASIGSPDSKTGDKLGKREFWVYLYKVQYTPRMAFQFDRGLLLEFTEGRLTDWRED